MSGKNNPMYGKKDILHPRYGLKHNNETKQQISNKNAGHITTEKTKKKISDSLKGRIFSDETRQKISESKCGTKLSIETKTKISETKKKLNQSAGPNNPKASRFLFVSPNEKTYIVYGEFSKFITEHNMSYSRAKQYINKGKIPKSRRPSIQTNNMINWEIRRIEYNGK